MKTIIGVDFSGAALAGQKIWVAHATLENGVLRFHELQRGADLPDSGEARETVMPALVKWIFGFTSPLCGFDFPFSLTRDAVGDDWLRWLQNEVVPCPDAETFKANFPDIRRQTDVQAKTPFSPLNLRLYRQTFYGLRDVIAPLVAQGAGALPMQQAAPDVPWLLEVCPASLLKREKLYLSYKGKSGAQRANREIIWQEMQTRIAFEAAPEIEQRALDDSEGDALDAVLAAIGVHRALQNPALLKAQNALERCEGRVYS